MSTTTTTTISTLASKLPYPPNINLKHAESIHLLTDALTELQSGVSSHDEKVTRGGIRRFTTCLKLKYVPDIETRIKALNLAAEVGLQACLNTPQDWVTLSTAGMAVDLCVNLLDKFRPLVIGKIPNLHWRFSLAAARQHVFPRDDNIAPNHGHSSITVQHYRSNLSTLISLTRQYQDPGTAEQVCKEFEPMALVPSTDKASNDSMIQAELLAMFYPSYNNDDGDAQARLDRWMKAIPGFLGSEWETIWFALLNRMVDWTPGVDFPARHLPEIFARARASLFSPDAFFGNDNSRASFFVQAIESGQFGMVGVSACLLVRLLHVEDAIKRLEHLLASVRTIAHPSNSGSKHDRLGYFCLSLCSKFAVRCGKEAALESWLKTHNNTTKSFMLSRPYYPLTSEQKRSFVEMLLPILEMLMFSKQLETVHSAYMAIRELAFVAPSLVSARFMPDLITKSLDPSNLIKTHQAPAAMKLLGVLVGPLFQDAVTRQDLCARLVPLLNACLPGIDPNDTRKTMVTLSLVLCISQTFPLVNMDELRTALSPRHHGRTLSTAQQPQPPPTAATKYGIDPPPTHHVSMEVEEDDDDIPPLAAASSTLAEWGLDCIRRVFVLAKARGMRAKDGRASQMLAMQDKLLALVMRSLLWSMCKRTRARATQEIATFLLEEGPLLNAMGDVNAMMSACVSCDGANAVIYMLTPICELIFKDPPSSTEGRLSQWGLEILGNLVRLSGGDLLLPHLKLLEEVCVKAFEHKEDKVRKLGCKLVRRIARGLIGTYVVYGPIESDEMEFTRVMKWGQVHQTWGDHVTHWHVPSEAEEAAGVAFLNRFESLAVWGVGESLAGDKDAEVIPPSPFANLMIHGEVTGKEKLRFYLQLFSNVLRARTGVMRGDPMPVIAVRELHHRGSDGDVTTTTDRERLVNLTTQFVTAVETTTDVESLAELVSALTHLGNAEMGAGEKSQEIEHQYLTSVLGMITHCGVKDSEIYMTHVLKFEVLGQGDGFIPDRQEWGPSRVEMCRNSGVLWSARMHESSYSLARASRTNERLGNTFALVGNALERLCLNDFSVIRVKAQHAMLAVDAKFPWRLQSRFEAWTRVVASDIVPQHWTGALYMIETDMNWVRPTRNHKLKYAFLKALIVDAPNTIAKLPPHKQAKSQTRYLRVLSGVLDTMSQVSKDLEDVTTRLALAEELAQVVMNDEPHWGRLLNTLTAIVTLLPTKHTPQVTIPARLWHLVQKLGMSDLFQVRLASFYCMRRLLMCDPHNVPVCDYQFWQTCADTLAEDRNAAHAEDQAPTWSAGVNELMRTCFNSVVLPHFPENHIPLKSKQTFHIWKTNFWFCVASQGAMKAQDGDRLVRYLASDVHSSKDRIVKRFCLAELACGLTRAGMCLDAVQEIAIKVWNETGTAEHWCDGLRFSCWLGENTNNTNPPTIARQFWSSLLKTELTKVVINDVNGRAATLGPDGEPTTEFEKSTSRGFGYAANLMRIATSICFEYVDFGVELLPLALTLLEHPYRAVRFPAASCVASLVWFDPSTRSAPVTQRVLDICAKGDKDGVETGLQFCFVMFRAVDVRVTMPFLYVLMGPVVFAASDHSDLELAKSGKAFLIGMASGLHAFSLPDAALALEQRLVDDFGQSPDWTKRCLVAQFLGPFHANHSSLLFRRGSGPLVQKTAENMLLDGHAAVREAGRVLLKGVWAAAPVVSEIISKARDRYLNMAHDAKNVNRKRQGVLALTSLMEAFPYEIPKFLVPVVVELSRVVAMGGNNDARKSLSEFRRTHQDEWAEKKLVFTQEELDVVDNVLTSPDYYS